nr:MFS transporter [Micromonospora sp. DSM 115978]
MSSPWRGVYTVAAGRGLAVCADFLIATTLVLVLQSGGHSGLAVAAVLLAKVAPIVVLAPLAGRLADRVDPRRLLVTVGIGQAGTATALALVDHPVSWIALVALLSAGLAVSQPTISALIPDLVDRTDLPRANAVNQTAGTIGMMTGPALAGVLLGQLGRATPLLIAVLGYLALAGAGLALRTRRPVAGVAEPAAGDGGPVAAGRAWSAWRDPLLRAIMISIAAVVGGVGAINVVHVFFVRETLGASETMYGFVEATEMAGLLAGAWIFAKLARRIGDDGRLVRGVLLLLGGICAAFPLVSVIGMAGWLLPVWAVTGSLNGGLNVFTGVVFANRAPAEFRGRAFAALGATVQAAAVLGYFAGGVLVEALPIRPLIAGLGVVGLLVVAGLAPAVFRATRRPDRAAPRLASLPGPGTGPVADPGSGPPAGADGGPDAGLATSRAAG